MAEIMIFMIFVKADFWQQIFIATMYDITNDIFSMSYDQKNMSFKTQADNNTIYPFFKVWIVEMRLYCGGMINSKIVS